MKKLIRGVILCVFVLFIKPSASTAQRPEEFRQENLESPSCSQKAEDLFCRIDDIEAMDKSNMSREEKKALRTEVKSIQKELQEMGSGVYISAGALIVILILLIILL